MSSHEDSLSARQRGLNGEMGGDSSNPEYVWGQLERARVEDEKRREAPVKRSGGGHFESEESSPTNPGLQSVHFRNEQVLTGLRDEVVSAYASSRYQSLVSGRSEPSVSWDIRNLDFGVESIKFFGPYHDTKDMLPLPGIFAFCRWMEGSEKFSQTGYQLIGAGFHEDYSILPTLHDLAGTLRAELGYRLGKDYCVMVHYKPESGNDPLCTEAFYRAFINSRGLRPSLVIEEAREVGSPVSHFER